MRLPKIGRYYTTPLTSALATGFHSMVELLLAHCLEDENINILLLKALDQRRLDLVQLLYQHGAEPHIVPLGEVLRTGSKPIILWFEEHGMDLQTEYPLAKAFEEGNRGALGVYMRNIRKIPSLHYQAAMALRHYAEEGNMRWVSLLLWAGVDPRLEIEDIKYGPNMPGTALGEAVRSGNLEVVKKIGLDPKKDDLNRYLRNTAGSPKIELVKLLLELGADPNNGGDVSAVANYVDSLGHAMNQKYPWLCDHGKYLEILKLFASKGGRWNPSNSYEFRGFRTALAAANPGRSVYVLFELMKMGIFEKDIFRELVHTPRMRNLLNSGFAGTVILREFAGQPSKSPTKMTLPKKKP